MRPEPPVAVAGFTLIEVLVAISILAMMSVLIWQASGTTLSSKERFEKQDEAFQEASLALQRMSRDLEASILLSTPNFLGKSGSGELRTKSVFIGKDEGDQDQVTFHGIGHLRYLKDVKESDQAEVSYFLEPNPEEAGLFLLKKRESSPPDDQPEEGGTVQTLLDSAKELNFRYFDPQRGEFFDGWDSTKLDQLNKLPRAVEIVLVVQNPVDEEKTLRFQTTAFLGMAPGPNDF